MDKNIILMALNLAMFIINHWVLSETLTMQNDIIKRDQDFIQETARIINSRTEEKRSEE